MIEDEGYRDHRHDLCADRPCPRCGVPNGGYPYRCELCGDCAPRPPLVITEEPDLTDLLTY